MALHVIYWEYHQDENPLIFDVIAKNKVTFALDKRNDM